MAIGLNLTARSSLRMQLALGLSLTALRRAGIVHDIGKVAVPDAVLLKPARLTPEEMEVMKQHTVVGERICAPLKSFRLVLPIIRHHHEKLNGTGYPDGLRGDAASIEGRVLAVADVLDAMSTERPYRGALSIEETMAFLIDNRGVLFDSAVIDALVESRPELARLRV